ncbi:MAG TPA: DUF4388 domain-containing protein [Thermoanaerobaculia bacterium]
MSASGLISTMSVPDLIQWARAARRTGALTLHGEGGTEIRIAFRDGQICFTATSDPRQRYSRYLVYRGLCAQEEIDHALRVQHETGTMMAAALVHSGVITREEAETTLTRKSFEDLCGALLWGEGRFLFVPQTPPLQTLLPIDVDPINVMMEAARRADHWARMTSAMHTGSFFEANGEAWPEQATWEDEEAARAVRVLLDGRRNLADLASGLPFSRFTIWRAVWELYEKRLIQPVARARTLPPETPDRLRIRDGDRTAPQHPERPAYDGSFDIGDVPVLGLEP